MVEKGEFCKNKISNQIEVLYDLVRFSTSHTITELALRLQIPRKISDGIRSFLRDYVAMMKDETILEMYDRMWL